MKPLQIIGGGLAGLSLGIALRRAEVPVSIVEAGTYPRHRVCGEFICGIQQQTIEALGIQEVFADAHLHRTIAFHRLNRVLYSAEIPRPAIGLSRFALDARLAERFTALGGTLQTATKATLPTPAAEGTVYAAGRHVERSPWIGLKMHFRDLQTQADLELHLGDGGYAGLSAVEGGATNVCGLFRRRAGVRARKADLLTSYLRQSGLHHLADRLGEATACPESALGISSVKFHKTWENDGCCHLGDHFAVIPPFTGNGMSLAIESACLAATPLRAWAGGGEPWSITLAEIRKQIQQRFRTRLITARLLHPWIYTRPGQEVLALLARGRLLPFHRLFHLTH